MKQVKENLAAWWVLPRSRGGYILRCSVLALIACISLYVETHIVVQIALNRLNPTYSFLGALLVVFTMLTISVCWPLRLFLLNLERD